VIKLKALGGVHNSLWVDDCSQQFSFFFFFCFPRISRIVCFLFSLIGCLSCILLVYLDCVPLLSNKIEYIKKGSLQHST
jgi:hypothetical protein